MKSLSPRIARGIAWFLVAVYIILSSIGLYLQALSNTSPGDIAIPLLPYFFAVIVVGIWPAIGAQIISHHPRHPVGWLLFVTFPVIAIVMFAIGYASYAFFLAPGLLPIPGVILFWLNDTGMPIAIVALTLMYLLFPTGKLQSPRWRSVSWISIGVLPVIIGLRMAKPGPLSLFPNLDNPNAVSEPAWAIFVPLYLATIAVLTFCNLAGLVSLILQLRRARGDEVHQVKWLVLPAVIYWIGILFDDLAYYDPDGILLEIGVGLHLVSVPAIVIAVAFAIFKYRLYDIKIIINRALVYGALTASVVGLYVLIVGGAGLVVQTNLNLATLLITLVLVGVVYRPMHAFFQRGVDRLMYGKLGVVPNLSLHHPTPREHLTQNIKASPAATTVFRSPARWLRFARLAWYPTFATAVGLFIASIPGFFIIGSGGVADPRFSANPSPLIGVLDWITILGAMAVGLLSLFLAALLFRRRSGDPMALMTSFYLLAYGVIMAGPLEALEPFFPGIASFAYNLLMPAFVPFSLLLFAVFPDGRFVPRWTRWAVLAAFLAVPFALFWTSLYTRGPLDFSQPVVLVSAGVVTVLVAAIWLSTLFAQIYRYRYVSTAEQRQQTKWVVYGTGIWLSLQMILTVPWIFSFSLPPGTPYPWWLSVSGLFWVLFLAVIPVTLTIAVMRYRLFEIDSIINRTLVYGALTASVVAMYALLVGALGALLHAQGNLIIALLATGLVAVLFQPLRARLQRGINRMMYGERDDPATVFARLGDLLEASASHQETLPGLVKTIAQTLKLPYTAIELGKEGDREVVAAYGNPSGEIERFALVYQLEEVGSLIVTYRAQGEEFTLADRQLLENIAHQAGAVAHAVHLTNELQRSRLRLVTAREEERRRLRRDLHDELGPQLASQALIIDALEKRLHKDPASAVRLLEELKKQSQRAVQDIRQIIYDLRPPALDDLGLVGAIREALAGHQRSGVSFQLQATADMPPLPAAVEVATYRIIQEAATNVIRHAKAKRCSVRIDYHNLDEGSELRLVIVDDGIGIPQDRRNGVGLNSMRERAAELGGDFNIILPSEGGTRVTVRLPISREAA